MAAKENQITKIIASIMGLRLVRAMQRYGAARGALLSGGIAYSALFAVAGALTLGLTAFSYVLGGNEQLRTSMVAKVNEALPGVLKTQQHPEGLVSPDALILDNLLNPATIISALVLLWSALSLMGSLRSAIQAMAGISRLPGNFFTAKLMDLFGFLILGAGALVGILLTAGATFFADEILAVFGGGFADTVAQIFAFALGILVDAAVAIFLFRIMAGVRAPRKDLLIGGVVMGVGSGVLRLLGTTAVSSVSGNPLLAPFAAIITLLLWVNLLARITLIGAAITVNPPAPLANFSLPGAGQTPNYVTYTVPYTSRWPHDPISGTLVAEPRAGKPKSSEGKAA
ncbi:MAG: YihY/virulence factor BrkB family protein [Trueperella sp.]|nr:YihY/virulence factor BrkB family protein [Trueperella sp.]